MKPEGSLPHSQLPATCPQPELHIILHAIKNLNCDTQVFTPAFKNIFYLISILFMNLPQLKFHKIYQT